LKVSARWLLGAVLIGSLPASAAEVPSDDLVFWADATGLSRDGARWLDRSERRNDLAQAVASRRPATKPDAAGLPTVAFDGDDRLERAALRGFSSGDQPFHVFVVLRATMHGDRPNPRLLELGKLGPNPAKGDGRQRAFWFGYQNDGRVRLGITHGDEARANTIAWDGRLHVLEFRYEGAQRWSMWIDGREDGSGVFSQRPFLGFEGEVDLAVGQQSHAIPANTFYRGGISELLILSRALDDAGRAPIGLYLATKYGLDTEFTPPPHYERDIAPLIQEHCESCHRPEKTKAGLDLSSLAAIVRGGDSGPALVRSHPRRSKLLRLVEAGAMPPSKKKRLSPREVATIRRWIEAGLPADVEVADPPPRELVSAKDRDHWAFRRLRPVGVPANSERGDARLPVDAFLLAKLESRGLELSPIADRHALVRRVFLDVLGLLPTPDEIDEFVGDARPDAYDRLVDRVLSSPHFGERWGRHWLDVGGYSDIGGADNDAIQGDGTVRKVQKGKWRYRDYVIASFNDDLPLDRFLLEQFAGDELVDWRSEKPISAEARRLLIATGFLRSGIDDTDENELNTPDQHHFTLQRTGEMVATGLLGLTFECSKCHDHKFEPIPQRDYYRLLSFFEPAFSTQYWLQPAKRELRIPDVIQAVYDVDLSSSTRVLYRGEVERPLEEVSPGFPVVLCDSEKSALLREVELERVGRTTGRRRALAEWLSSWGDPSGALVARVWVNRVWEKLFGRGLVASVGNFGRTGSPPTHPELLEWLAGEFVRSGRRTKPIVAALLRSRAYRQTGQESASHAKAREIDPANELYWRSRLRRLEAEIVRDSILCASGSLDRKVGGPPLDLEMRKDGRFVVRAKGLPSPAAAYRRSVYILARRNYHLSMLDVFDQPAMGKNCVERRPSAVVLQSLAMLNDEFVIEQARELARQVFPEKDRVGAAFARVLCRPPTEAERDTCDKFLEEQARQFRQAVTGAPPLPVEMERSAVMQLCHVLLNTSEFLYAR